MVLLFNVCKLIKMNHNFSSIYLKILNRNIKLNIRNYTKNSKINFRIFQTYNIMIQMHVVL